jgi:hypothetical protein
MTRKTALMLLTGMLLVGGFGAPALADPVNDSRESVCLRLDPSGGREGYCVWVGLPGER